MPSYRVVMCNQAGGEPTELVRAKLRHVTWELNSWGEAVWSMPVLDAQASAAILMSREVQVWRDGVCIFWGIPWGGRADKRTVTFTAYGLLWHFAGRYFGPVYSDRMPQMLTNGDFELDPLINGTGIGGWAATGAATAASTTRRKFGSRAIKLTTTGTPDQYIIQQLTLPTPARIRPLKVTASAWVYPEVITTPAFEDRGIFLFDTVTLQENFVPISKSIPMGEWTRLEASIELPAGASNALGLALYAPDNGIVYWDKARATYQQRTGAREGEDYSDDMMRRIFNYGAGNSFGGSEGPGGSVIDQKAWWGAPVKKSSLGMTWLGSTVAAGSLGADRWWDHEDAANIYDAMAQLAAEDRMDFEVTWDAGGHVRSFATYPEGKGSLKPALALELGRNMVDFAYDVDGRQTANDVRVVGRNSGNTKEVGQAGGPTPYTMGGHQREAVIAAPVEVDGQGLTDMAVAEEARRREPVKVPTLTVKAGGLLDTTHPGGPLTVGDTVPVRIRHGWVQEVGTRRVVKMTLRPDRELLDLVVN